MRKILNKRNVIIGGVVVVVIAIVVIVATSFSSAMTLDEAKKEAGKYVPDSAEFIGSDEDYNDYEVYFYDKEAKESLEVEIHKDSKKIKKIERQLDNDLGSATVKLSEANVESIIKEKFEGVTSVTVNLSQDNGLYEYEVKFKGSEFYGSADVNPETGAILESEVKFGSAAVVPKDESDDKKNESNQSSNDTVSSSDISADKVRSIVLQKIPGATILSMNLESDDGIRIYEGEARLDNMEYDFEINAASGVIVKWDQEAFENDIDD